MQGYMFTLEPNGLSTMDHLHSPPSLEKLQAAVGGYLEQIPGFDNFEGRPCVAFCNEEGKINSLPWNAAASGLWLLTAPEYAQHDYLVGNVVIVFGDEQFMRAL